MPRCRDLDIVVRLTRLSDMLVRPRVLTTSWPSTAFGIRKLEANVLHQGTGLETMIMIFEQVSAPRVLLVDDEIQPLQLRAQIMKLHGFSVLTADGPMKAISLMAKEAMEKIQVAILDYNMPGMNGCVLAMRLRSAFPELKTILYSGAIDIPSQEVGSVDVVVSKADGIATLISQVMQFVQVSADRREPLAVR